MSRGYTPSILEYLREREQLKKKFFKDQRKALQSQERGPGVPAAA